MQTLSHSIIRDHISHIVLHFHLLRFDDFLIDADASQFDELFIKSHSICTLFDIKSFLIFVSSHRMISTRN